MNDKPVEEVYIKKNLIEHILSLPDTYIGSLSEETKRLWIVNNDIIVKKKIEYVPGFYKTCDELIVNARDHQIKDKTCNKIKINIDKDKGYIEVWNNGNGIPIEIHKEYNIYIPELIFGHLLTSSNYDIKKKIVGGKNGYGAKLANIYSKKFIIETANNDKIYYQEFFNNMSKVNPPIIKKWDKESFTRVRYYPDFKKFNMDGLSEDVINLLKKRAYDIAGCSDEKVKVFVDNKLLKVKNFVDFIKLHFNTPPDLIYEKINDRWELGIVVNGKGGDCISFVNGIWTYDDGTHVVYILNQIVKKLIERIKTKKNNFKINNDLLRQHIIIFINSIIDDPSFDSQTKGKLTTKVIDFGSKCIISEKIINKLLKTSLPEILTKYSDLKESLSLSKTDGKKTNKIRVNKLDDAHWAGTSKSEQTRLFITEGDSAKSFAISGIGVIGRDKYGAFPLKGKLLNVRKCSKNKISKNVEFNNLKKIIGLKQGLTYEDGIKGLRYGGVIILTDQDPDGFHIKGLFMNMIHFFWPNLFKNNFFQVLSTPLVKAFHKKGKKEEVVKFYYEQDYEKWAEKQGLNIKNWTIKYYKGLGTSTNKEAKESFEDFDNKLITYVYDKNDNIDEKELEKKMEETKKSLELAFDNDFVESRKEWINTYDEKNVLSYKERKTTITDFINKELIHFSNVHVIRSIPSIYDGLKPSQRKIIYTCLKNNIKKEVKVYQLASTTASITAYKHGEKSLQDAIVSLAQNFPGSNNINLLYPGGNFGCRSQGGKEAAQARYIFTRLSTITKKIIREEDDCILDFLIDENQVIEPRYYLPIIPLILVNGAHGIGTGFSVDIYPHNPLDIIDNIKSYLNNKSLKDMNIWFKDFKGEITKLKKNTYNIKGVYKILNNKVIITEIPLGDSKLSWQHKYIKHLNNLMDKKIIKNFKSESGNNTVYFEVIFEEIEIKKIFKFKDGIKEIEKILLLNTVLTTKNLHLRDKFRVKKYNDTKEILQDYIEERYSMYVKRKKTYLKILLNELNILKYKRKFINYVLSKKIIVFMKDEETIINSLIKFEFPQLSPIWDSKDINYKYLTEMKLFSLCKGKIEELTKSYELAKKRFLDYKTLTINELWIRELDELKDSYIKWLKDEKEE